LCMHPSRAISEEPPDLMEGHPLDGTDSRGPAPESREIPADSIELIKQIGEGMTSEVWRGRLRGEVVAIKKLRGNAAGMSLSMIQAAQRELRILANVQHPHIMKFIGLVVEEEEDSVRWVLEYCYGDSLFHLLHNKWNINLCLAQRFKMLIDTASAQDYLHNMDPPIIHRDLKSLNLMLAQPVEDEFTVPDVKLADFGYARIEERAMTQAVGTKHWMAPEVLTGTEYTTKADVFSFAMVIFEAAFRHVPFERLKPHQVAQRIVQGVRPDNDRHIDLSSTPPRLLELIRACWQQNPDDRPDFVEIHERLIELASQAADEIF